jgi:hypothetical protein
MGTKIDLSVGSANEGTGRVRGSEPTLMSCRKNRLCIIIDYIVLYISTGIYRIQES